MSEEKDFEQDYDFRIVDNIRVIGRFRPPVDEEKREEKIQQLTDDEPLYCDKQEVSLSRSENGKQEAFKCILDHIFRSSASQKQVFNLVGRPMVQAVLEGYNATIFAYGQTGSGKTFTMFGPEKRKNEAELGLVQRCCSYLFEKLHKRSGRSNDEIRAWQLTAEFLQIYKDNLSDLLEPSKAQRLNIRTNFQTDTPYVENLKSISVENINDLLIALSQAYSNRVVASHKLNATSSRSHMLLMLTLEQQMSDGSVKRSKLNFGDLAGSEDIAKALGPKPDPERMREAIAINSSLTALTTAISNLVKNQRPSYRSSPLTHILQESLGGNSKTTMIVACSSHFLNRPETIRTLRFATQAKQVKNKARVNKEETRAQLLRRIAELEALNQKLKTRVIELETFLKENGYEVEVTAELYEDRNRSTTVATDDNDEETVKENKNNQPKKLIAKKIANSNTNLSVDVPVNLGIDSQRQPTDLTLQVEVSPQYQRFSIAHSIPALLNQIEELQQKVDASILENKEINEKNRQLTTEIESLDSQIHALREQNEQLNNKEKLFNKERSSFEERIMQLTKESESSKNATIKQQQDLDNQIQRQRNNLQVQIEEKKELQKQVKDLSLQNDELVKQNAQMNAQLFYARKHGAKLESDKQADLALKEIELQLEAEEKEFSPAELILHRFAATEVNDIRLTTEQKMKKTCSMMSELSADINSLMEQWLPKNKVRADRTRSKTLVFQVRQLIGHFNVLVNQMKAQEEASQFDLRLDIKRRDAEIKRLTEENKKVLQLQDDLAEKDDLITQMKKEKDELKFEIEQLRNQTQQQQDMIHDVQSQVRFLSDELGRNRSTMNALQGINSKDIFTSHSKNNSSGSFFNLASNDLQILDDELAGENETEIDNDPKDITPNADLKSQTAIQQWRNNLNVGDQLDAQDASGLWWTAEIKEIKADGNLKIGFDGWGDEYDEWMPRNSDKLAMYRSRYVTLSGDKKIIKEGPMQNEGKMFKTWRKRHFILYDNGKIMYYGNQGDDNPLGSINVLNVKNISKISYGKNKQFGFEIEAEGNHIWKFICDEEKEQIEWINAINSIQSKKSSQ